MAKIMGVLVAKDDAMAWEIHGIVVLSPDTCYRPFVQRWPKRDPFGGWHRVGALSAAAAAAIGMPVRLVPDPPEMNVGC